MFTCKIGNSERLISMIGGSSAASGAPAWRCRPFRAPAAAPRVMSTPASNSTLMLEYPSTEVEVIVFTSAIEFSSSSIGLRDQRLDVPSARRPDRQC